MVLAHTILLLSFCKGLSLSPTPTPQFSPVPVDVCLHEPEQQETLTLDLGGQMTTLLIRYPVSSPQIWGRNIVKLSLREDFGLSSVHCPLVALHVQSILFLSMVKAKIVTILQILQSSIRFFIISFHKHGHSWLA